jgi:hypothetical protein
MIAAAHLVAGVWLGFGCGSTEEPTSDPVDSGAMGFGDTFCGLCVKATCASEASTCSSDPDCASWLSCLYACGTDENGDAESSCAAACPSATASAGAKAQHDFTACHVGLAQQKCDPCGAADCDGCRQKFCGDAQAACDTNPNCQTAATCLQACKTVADCDACIAPDPTAAQLANQLGSCAVAYCHDACGKNLCIDPCREPYLACYGDLDCFRVWLCVSFCGGNSACRAACSDSAPAAAAASFKEFSDCTLANCLGT